MKHIIYILIIFYFIPYNAISQNRTIDSLRYITAINKGNPLSNENIDSISRFLQRQNEIDFERKMTIAKDYFREFTTKTDTIYSNKRIYIEKKGSTVFPLNGFYSKYIALFDNVDKLNNLNGVYFPESASPFSLQGIYYPRALFHNLLACFKEGLPANEWVYKLSYSNDSIYKKENYKNGLLDGDYTIYNDTDTLYHTTFTHGTGYYKEYFPNGAVWMEGYVKNGYPESTWLFFVYNRERKRRATILEEYKNGKIIFQKTFLEE